MIFFVIVVGIWLVGRPSPTEREAIKAADAWLETWESANYEELFAESSLLIKEKDFETWKSGLMEERSGLGVFKSRRLNDTIDMGRLLPRHTVEGGQVLVTYDARFENDRVRERITVIKEDGWKVYGYFID